MDIDIALDPNNAPDPNELYHPIIRKLGKTSINNASNDNDLFLDFVLFDTILSTSNSKPFKCCV